MLFGAVRHTAAQVSLQPGDRTRVVRLVWALARPFLRPGLGEGLKAGRLAEWRGETCEKALHELQSTRHIQHRYVACTNHNPIRNFKLDSSHCKYMIYF